MKLPVSVLSCDVPLSALIITSPNLTDSQARRVLARLHSPCASPVQNACLGGTSSLLGTKTRSRTRQSL